MGGSHRRLGTQLSGRPQLGLFAKAPIPGYAKTRLIPQLGAEGAAALQAALIDRALQTAATCDAALTLWTAGDADDPFWSGVQQRHGLQLAAQQGEDLGARMAHALSAMLQQGSAAVIIGSDCPALRSANLAAAFAALRRFEQVFIPAEDGGYVLVGSRRLVPEMFRDIAWGTASVMAQTRARLAAAGVDSVCELPTLWDLDTAEDWERARAAGWVD